MAVDHASLRPPGPDLRGDRGREADRNPDEYLALFRELAVVARRSLQIGLERSHGVHRLGEAARDRTRDLSWIVADCVGAV